MQYEVGGPVSRIRTDSCAGEGRTPPASREWESYVIPNYLYRRQEGRKRQLESGEKAEFTKIGQKALNKSYNNELTNKGQINTELFTLKALIIWSTCFA